MKTTLLPHWLRRLALLLLFVIPAALPAWADTRADVNGDGEVTVADLNAVIDVILRGNGNHYAADVNNDGEITIADIDIIIDTILHSAQIPEDVHIYGDTPGSEGNVWLVTDDIVVITCPIGQEPKVGDIIVSGVTEFAPVGFLRRVEEVQTSFGQCIVTTTNASLEEVLPDGDYHIDIPLILPGQESTLYSTADAPSRVKFSTEFKGTVKLGWVGDVPNIKFDIWPLTMTPEEEHKKENEVLNGQVDTSYPLQFIAKLKPSLELLFYCKVKGRKIQRLELGGGMDITSELLMKATLEKEFNYEGVKGKKLPGSINLTPITVMVGPVPVVFTPKLNFYLGASLKGEMYMQFKLMSASASGNFSYIYTREPDPVTGQRHNFYHDFKASTLGDGDMEKRFQKWLAPKVGLKGSAKCSLSAIPNVSLYNANDIFNVDVSLSPWVKADGNISLVLDANNLSELDYEDKVGLTCGADIGTAAQFKLFGKKETCQKIFTIFETELMVPFALTPRFERLRVTPNVDPIPATSRAIGFGAYMTKPKIQLLPDEDYGFAYGPKDDPNRTATWTFISLKEEYDPEFIEDQNKPQYIQTAIDPALVEPSVPYRVSPYVQFFGHVIYKKGENFMVVDSVPCITVTDDEVDFGDVLVGSYPTHTLEIVNESAWPQTVKVEVTSPFAIGYNGNSLSSQTYDVPGNSSSSVTLIFSAYREGDYHGTVTFTSTAIEGGSIVVPLHGCAMTGNPIIDVSPSEIHFGEVPVGQTKVESMTVTNIGHGILKFSLSDTSGDVFSITESGQEFSLNAGESKAFDVIFIPKESDNIYGTFVSVFSNAENGTKSVAIDGKGVNPIEPQHEYVDLGLPSGTLWATCNIGASRPEGYGDYFSWGETAPKQSYAKEHYKWWRLESCGDYYTKYYVSYSWYASCATVDNKRELDFEDDAAYVNWGPSWRMPSESERDELRTMCSWQWTTSNGVNGFLVKGPNGNTLFLPAAGRSWDDTFHNVGSEGFYWSRTLYTNNCQSAICMGFHSNNANWYNSTSRTYGMPVRPVFVLQN